MKKFNIKYLIIIITGLLVWGCKESFLDLKPLALESEESYYSNMTAADKAVTAIYSNFCIEKVWDLSIMMTLGSIASDEAEAGAGGKADVVEFNHVDQMRHTPTEANVFDWSYGYIFRAINHANIAIEKLPKITKETDPNFDQVLLNKRLGEARFLRAYNYFVATQIFGGVPLMDHVPLPSEYTKGRDEISKIYDLIKGDLRYAISVLPEKSQWGKENAGRASKGAARALMAKVFLYESSYAKYYPGDERFKGMTQQWDSALYFAKQVIESGENKLLGIDGETFDTWWSPKTGGYRQIFQTGGNNSSESVFEIQNVQDGMAWFNTRGTALVMWTAVRQVNLINKPGTVQDFGWGWMSPAKALIDAYETGDPRYKATVLTENDSIYINITADGGLKWRKPGFTRLFDGTGLKTNCRKYECSYDEYWKATRSWQDGPLDVKLIRFADVVLWAAEASLELGQNDKALEYINMVRTRARNSGTTGVPANLTAVTHDDIVHERLVELACEGHRFFDLVRWNLATKYLNHTLADGDQITFESPKNDFFPLPAREVALSGNNLEQYPGW